MIGSKEEAQQVQALLAAGRPFEQVAKNPANNYRASQGGLMTDRVSGDKFSGFDALNEAMAKLKVGEHSPMVETGGSFWWVKVETFEQGESRSLDEVQLEVRQILENQQRNTLGIEFRRKLLEEGSYNSVEQMAEQLLEIAMSRYSQPLE